MNTAPEGAHVVHLTTVHDRSDVRIFHKQCRSLATAGYRVTLLVADGHGDEQREGVCIADLGRRPVGRFARMTLLPWRALLAVRRLQPSLLHFHDPELLTVAGLMAQSGLVLIYDAHEDVPQQILSKHWLPGWLRPTVSRAFAAFEAFVARRLCAVVVANPPNQPRFAALGCNAVCIANYPLLDEFPTLTHRHRQTRTLAYVGGLTRTRGVVQLVQALSLIPDVRLVLCGRFSDDGAEAACRVLPGWQQVEFLGHVDREAIEAVLAAAEVGMVTLLPEPAYRVALPVKMFEYMAAGLPVIASDIPLWRDIVDTHRCGVTVDPTDPAAIARTICAVLADPERRAMGERGRQAVLQQFNWRSESRKLLSLYARACN